MRTTGRSFTTLFLLLGLVGVAASLETFAKSEKALANQTSAEIEQGEQFKSQMLEKHQQIEGTPFNDVMNRVFKRLIATPEVAARDLPYEIFLVKSDEANAFCAPGGKVFVLSGITSIVRDDEDMWAAVLGHELAHAVRSHSISQQSKAKGLSGARKALGFLGRFAPGLGQVAEVAKYADVAEKAGRVGQALGFLSPFLMRKFSRSDESDADAQGILYMAKAGFDPSAAIRFHNELVERFGDSKAFTTFVKTHPRGEVRIEHLESLLPLVKQMAASPEAANQQVVPRSSADDSAGDSRDDAETKHDEEWKNNG